MITVAVIVAALVLLVATEPSLGAAPAHPPREAKPGRQTAIVERPEIASAPSPSDRR